MLFEFPGSLCAGQNNKIYSVLIRRAICNSIAAHICVYSAVNNGSIKTSASLERAELFSLALLHLTNRLARGLKEGKSARLARSLTQSASILRWCFECPCLTRYGCPHSSRLLRVLKSRLKTGSTFYLLRTLGARRERLSGTGLSQRQLFLVN